MTNGKTLVITLFPASKPQNHIIKKSQSLIFARQRANKKRYPNPNPNLKLNPTCNLSSNPNVNPNLNSKSKP